MKKIARVLAWFLFVSAFLLAGCATPLPKGETTPKLYGTAGNDLAVAVIEARQAVVSGSRTPQYEGFARSGFGIPTTVNRPNRPANETFASQLAGMVKDGFAQEGIKVTVVETPLSAPFDETLGRMARGGARRSVAIRMDQCSWEFGMSIGSNITWDYDFSVAVAGPDGKQLQSKRFNDREVGKPGDYGGDYTIFDQFSIRYRKLFEKMLSDPAIRQALQN
jgi:hypothetical protein